MNVESLEDTSKHELLTVPEAGKLLRIQTSTVRSWILQRRIPFVKMGRLVRIRKADCLALITTSLVPALDRKAA